MTRPIHRQLAHDWRNAGPMQRQIIEAQITDEGMWPLFSKRDGVLYARVTEEDHARRMAAGTGFMPARLRREVEEFHQAYRLVSDMFDAATDFESDRYAMARDRFQSVMGEAA